MWNMDYFNLINTLILPQCVKSICIRIYSFTSIKKIRLNSTHYTKKNCIFITILIKFNFLNFRATAPKTWIPFEFFFLMNDSCCTVIVPYYYSIITSKIFTSTHNQSCEHVSDISKGIFGIAFLITTTKTLRNIWAYLRLLASTIRNHILVTCKVGRSTGIPELIGVHW